MTVSVILSFYDRDEILVDSVTEIVERLSREVSDKYNVEFLIVDDRKDKSRILSKSQKYFVEPYEGNKGLIYSRWWGFRHSLGDYIWFIDCDDKILKFPNIIPAEKMYVFNHTNSYDKKLRLSGYSGKMDRFSESDFKNNRSFFRLGLWNKWFRRDLVEYVYSDYGIDSCPDKYINYFAFEDCIFNFTALSHLDNFMFINDVIYEWRFHELDKPFTKEELLRALDTVPEGYSKQAMSCVLEGQGYFRLLQ